MLARLARELVPAAKCPLSLSNTLESLCHSSRLSLGDDRANIGAVYSRLVAPCLSARTSILVPEPEVASNSFLTVSIKFHDHPNLILPDYFSGLGYILSLQHYGPLSLIQRIKLLALYAKVCKLSSPLVQSRAPTTVQLLWVSSPHSTDNRVVLGSSLAWTKIRAHFQMARTVREGILRGLWGDSLINPTPMQACFPNPTGALFGTCWGDCAEAISLSAFWKHVAAGTPLRTLALNVAAMNAADPLTGLSACDVILDSTITLNLQEIVGILTRANAFRPMCKNCEHICDTAGADVVDCACPDLVFWRQLDSLAAPEPQAIFAGG
ncbi:hypothetical protein C8F04DRAFT_669618 [Mycena alexandri]|uniref:Uncharacterized protein n=1 Tax=Mycena alexandri TaxID=1745969 RepID=A0AAD6WYC6_9AGAR|nr:hypothetical protein C8F04DRAFT_669618 [Mycena alexandri]